MAMKTPNDRPNGRLRNITLPKALATSGQAMRRNVQAITELENDSLLNRSSAQRVGDRIGRIAGSMGFVIFNAIWYATWIVVNTGLIPGIEPFDPFPFTFLTLCVSLEAIFLSIFVLMSQNRMARQTDFRSHLDLQIDLLAEEETTKMLKMLHEISEHLGLRTPARDVELEELEAKTEVQSLVQELKENLPAEDE